MADNLVSINGKITDPKEAVLPVDNIELNYGFGVYENIRYRNHAIYFADEHLDRLLHSAKAIGLTHQFEKKQIRNWIIELIKKNEAESANIKILLIGGVEPMLYILQLAPKFPDKKIYKEGVKAITAIYERYLPQAKTLNMLPSYILYKKAIEQNAYDAILCDKKGNIHEGTRSNIFFIKEKTLYTPMVETVLNGVTRAGVIACATKLGYTIIEESIALKNIATFDGAFFTNTSGKIIPIKEIDGQTLGQIPPSTAELIKSFDEYMEQHAEKIIQ